MSDKDVDVKEAQKKSSASLWAVLLVALVGGAGAFYVTQNPSVTQMAIADDAAQATEQAEAAQSSGLDMVADAMQESMESASEAAESAVEQAVEAAGDAAESVSEATEALAEPVVESVSDAVADVTETEQTQGEIEPIESLVEEGPTFEELAAECKYPSLVGQKVSAEELNALGDVVRIYDGAEGVPVGAAVDGRINVEKSGDIVMRVWCDDEHAENLVTEAPADVVNEEPPEPVQAEADVSEETVSEE